MDALINNEELKILKAFFDGIKRLPDTIELDAGTKIIDLSLFIESHLSILQTGNSMATQRPVLDRILQLKKILEKE
jgi:hypothetical protein